jgi:hypothetical protein
LDVVNDLEAPAIVGEEVSNLWRAETSKTSFRIKGLHVVLRELLYRIPLIELLNHIGPSLNVFCRVSVQVPHGLGLVGTANLIAI